MASPITGKTLCGYRVPNGFWVSLGVSFTFLRGIGLGEEVGEGDGVLYWDEGYYCHCEI